MCRLINLLQRQLFPHLFHSHRMMYFALVAGIEFFYFLIHVSPGTSRPNRSTYFKTKQNEHLSLIKTLPPSTHLLPIFISTHTLISSGQPWLLSTYACIRTHEWAHTQPAALTGQTCGTLLASFALICVKKKLTEWRWVKQKIKMWLTSQTHMCESVKPISYMLLLSNTDRSIEQEATWGETCCQNWL